MTDTNGTSECSSVESFTDSWIQLDAKNGSSLQTSPKFSDEEEMEEVLADAQTELDKSVLKAKQVQEEKSEKTKKENKSVGEWIEKNENKSKKEKKKSNCFSLRGSKAISSGCDMFGSRTFFISSLIVSHTLALVLGLVLGKRYLSTSRSA